MNKLTLPVVLAAICLSACSGGGNSEKLIGSWTCDGPSRPNMEFKAGGLYLKTPSAIPTRHRQAGGHRRRSMGHTRSTAAA